MDRYFLLEHFFAFAFVNCEKEGKLRRKPSHYINLTVCLATDVAYAQYLQPTGLGNVNAGKRLAWGSFFRARRRLLPSHVVDLISLQRAFKWEAKWQVCMPRHKDKHRKSCLARKLHVVLASSSICCQQYFWTAAGARAAVAGSTRALSSLGRHI